jgi:FKBP-type peptidyl-prolyl cis-trans isomerase SlyD
MEIGKNTVVSLAYTLTDTDGNVIDQTTTESPFKIVHGIGQIIEGLEEALEGKKAGDKFEVTIEPEDAYGELVENMIEKVPLSQFEGVDNLKEGMQLEAHTEEGLVIVTVKSIEGDTVILDANHPLAGMTLNFDVEVVDVREASEEELKAAEEEFQVVEEN